MDRTRAGRLVVSVIESGAHGEYRWLSSPELDLATFVRLCPEAVIGRRVAVISIDSATLRLTSSEREAGWVTPGAKVYRRLPDGGREDREDWLLAVSPVLRDTGALPHRGRDECCDGFDEWMAFQGEVPPDDIESFVNWVGFRLNDPGWQWATDRFWKQLARLRPESYTAWGDAFTFATRNTALFETAAGRIL